MLMNPQKFASNKWIKSRFEAEFPLDLREDGKGQIQQAGFDVRAYKIQKIVGQGSLRINSKQLPTYVDISPNQDGCYVLQPNCAYAVDCIEDVKLPIGFEGKLIHRSTLNRSGIFLTGSVYDPGYEGLIGGTLYVHTLFQIEVGARIGQFQIQIAEAGTAYAGDFQKNTSHADGASKLAEK